MVKNSYILMLVPFAAVSLWAGDVAISDGQNAEEVVGQTDSGGAAIYTEGGAHESQMLDGLNEPFDVAVDTVSHRLFVTDYSSNRVLVYDLDSANVLVDRSADHVIGQSNFTSTLASVSQSKLNVPTNVCFDEVTTKLYVADSTSDRIVVFDVTSITDGENAIHVLGHATFSDGTEGTAIDRLYNPHGIAIDKGTQRLFVSESSNHRVTVFDVSTITDGESAINVLGQSDFTTSTNGRTQNTFNAPREIDFDPVSNRLFVTDYNNDRVMIFDVALVTDGENAINVLGQSNFTAGGAALTQARMEEPYGLVYDQNTQRLFVGQVAQHRVLIFDVAVVTDGENAANVLGQGTFTTKVSATTDSGLSTPRGLSLDAASNRLCVADSFNNRVLVFDVSTTTINDGKNADNVVGQTDGSGGDVYTTGFPYDGKANEGFYNPYGVAIDTVSHRLFVSEEKAKRVSVYDLDESNTLVDRGIDHVLGQADLQSNLTAVSQSGVSAPDGLAIDAVGNRLFLSENDSDRILVFDIAQITDGENAVNVLGQTTFTGATNGVTQSKLYTPSGLSYDPETSRLFVADRYNHRVLIFDVAVITDGENAINVLGQATFTTRASGTTQNSLNYPVGIAFDAHNRLYVSESSNHRVLVFDITAITDGENAVNVLGQSSFTSGSAAASQSRFNYPSGLAHDNTLNRLFVVETINDRVTVFDTAVITDGENAINVLGQTTFTGSAAATSQNRMSYPRAIAFDGEMSRVYVADAYNNRVLVHSVGPVSPSTSTVAATSGNPEEVVLTWTSAGDDGSFGDLTGNYRIQYATYVVTWSTSSTPANATTVTVATTTQVPGSAQSRTITSLLSGVTYYFVLWSQDESSNWSAISNSTSGVAGVWFDSSEMDVGGAGAGLTFGRVAWGDYDNDGDIDVLASGYTIASTRELRIYKSNGNGTIDATPLNVAGSGGGHVYSSVAWGDYDNDGDLDVLVEGIRTTYSQLRIYKNNGNGTMDSVPVEVSGANKGLHRGGAVWGDFDNDGDLDILANGLDLSSGRQLRVYKNNGNGTLDENPLDLDGAGGGLDEGSVAWGDYDNDGDLDVLASGVQTSGSSRELRIYKNNGNGTLDAAQIDIDGAGNGLGYFSGVGWGDFDSDGDLDVLALGDGASSSRQLRIYKNNGNGTLDSLQIEVDGSGGGLRSGGVAWGDFDNDGDLDILANGLDFSSGRQLRVYKNNGNGTMNDAQVEVDGVGGGISSGWVAWGDYDNDGDLDVLANGEQTSGNTRELRVYKNLSATPNTVPTAPVSLTGAWVYSALGTSTATFKWNAGSDNGAFATPVNGLTYQVEISSNSGFIGKSVVAGHWATPGMGNYLRPPLIFDGNTTHGMMLHYLPATNTTYYYRLKTIDAGLKESAWSATGSLYTEVLSSAPSAVVDLVASVSTVDGQIALRWTEPLNVNSGASAAYDVRYSLSGPITNDTEFNSATAVTGEPIPVSAGMGRTMNLTGLVPYATYYFAIKSSNVNGSSGLDISNPRPSGIASVFDAGQMDVGGAGGGLYYGVVAWGDYDNDGDLDLLASGTTGSSRELRIYKNNGNGTMDSIPIDIDGAGGGLQYGGVAWGDFDNDGDVDVLVNGYRVTSELRIYKNNGNGTMDPAQLDVAGSGAGLIYGKVAWGDFDNDGDFDVLVSGEASGGVTRELRIYKNNGNATMDPNRMDIDGASGGFRYSSVAWGDYDLDGDLDVLVAGQQNAGSTPELRVFNNNGNGTMDGAQIEVDGAAGGFYHGDVAWGDFDNDGDVDILTSGYSNGGTRELRVYKNNGNGTINAAQIEVDGAGGGLRYSSVAWGDHDNDGDLDVLVSGERTSASAYDLRVYKNNGNGTLDSTQIDVDGPNGGLYSGGSAWGDYDNDGDLDVLTSGEDVATSRQLRIYKNFTQLVQTNTVPTAPSSLLGQFAYNSIGVSVASFTWNAGTDSGTGATVENGLTYDIQISTTSNFSKLMFPGQLGASPRMGSYLKPPKIFNGNTSYGVVLKSTDPWNAQATASYGLRTDTTYYYRVKTVDSALAESAWSSAGTSYTGVAPSTSTLAAAATLNDGELVLTWNSAGDDGMIGNLTGNYRIQYATFTASWSTSTTPTDATTVTISTSNVVPGVSRSISVDVALIVEHYFVIWTQDEANNWSAISGTASATPFLGVRSMTIVSGSPLAFGSVNLGTQVVASTGVVVRNNGSLLNSYTLRASTYTAGTPWSVSNSPPAGPDALVLYGVYDGGTAPVLGDFGVEDVIETSAQVGSETKFSVSGAITGTSVPAGEDRPLWIRLDMPTTSQTVAPQSIRIEISAQPP
jgi:DNA-binding beta-propeller fold protein YncE/predicted nucleotidyltransferase